MFFFFRRLSVSPDYSSSSFSAHVHIRRNAVIPSGVMSASRLYSALSNKTKDSFDSQDFSSPEHNQRSRSEFHVSVARVPKQHNAPTSDQILESKYFDLQQTAVKKNGHGTGLGATAQRSATGSGQETEHEPILVKRKMPRSSRNKRRGVKPSAVPAESVAASAEGHPSPPLPPTTHSSQEWPESGRNDCHPPLPPLLLIGRRRRSTRQVQPAENSPMAELLSLA